jgi:hypothetical protein
MKYNLDHDRNHDLDRDRNHGHDRDVIGFWIIMATSVVTTFLVIALT